MDNAKIEQAKKDWMSRIYNNPEAVEALKEETWEGVLIGFLVGYGFTVEEAEELALSDQFPY